MARHLRLGWGALCVFAVLGLVLEGFHGIKLRAYLDASNDTRRLMFTLAHAHGTLLGAVQVLFAVTLATRPGLLGPAAPFVSRCLIAAGGLMPAGFLAGGVWAYAGDPGPGIVLVPMGAVLLVVALARITVACGRLRP